MPSIRPYDSKSDDRTMSPADSRQEGGDHYTVLPIQPWQIIEANEMGFFDGNALKYLLRYKTKDGINDLKKARHYIDKLIEMEQN